MFVQRLNAASGELEWCAADDDGAAAAVASSSYLDMLNDAPRNAAFAAALAVAAPGRRVLDIGTGTGLLALLAAAAGAACVTACEVFPPMAACAAANARRSGCGERVRVALKRSDELQVGADGDMAERAEVLVFEVLDSELLGEGVLPTLRDAKARLLTPGAAVIPARATVHAALIESDALRRCHARPPLAGGAAAEPHCGAEAASARGVATLAPMQALHLSPFDNELRVLSEPREVLRFDFQAGPVPPEAGAAGDAARCVALADGTAHAVALWWDADVAADAADARCRYSTAPGWARPEPQPPWTHHWRQCVAFLPGAGLPLRRGQAVSLRAAHDDHSIWLRVHAGGDDSTSAAFAAAPDADILAPPPPDATHAARLGSRERVWLLNDEDYGDALRAAAHAATKAAAPGAASLRIAVLGDGPAMARLAAAMPRAAAVTALVSQPDQLAVVARAVGAAPQDVPIRAAMASRFLRDADGGDDDVASRPDAFDVVMAEPHYALLDSLAPWVAARRLQRDVAALRRRGWLAPGAPCVPARAALVARLVALPALHRSRSAVGDVCGVDLAGANALLRPPCGGFLGGPRLAPAIAAPLSQCGDGYEPLSPPLVLARLDYTACLDAPPLAGAVDLPVLADGTAHAVALWVSYDGGDGGPAWGSQPREGPGAALRPCFRRQGVALLRAARRVRVGEALRVEWALDDDLELSVVADG